MPKLATYSVKNYPETPKFNPNSIFYVKNHNHFKQAPYKLSTIEFEFLQEREQKLSLCKDAVCKKAKQDLGYDFNDFYAPKSFKIDNIEKVKPFNHVNRPGSYKFTSIPFEDSDITRILKLEKHLIKVTEEKPKLNNNEVFINTTCFYMAEEFGKPIVFTVMYQKQYACSKSCKPSITEIELMKNKEPKDYSIAISIFPKGQTQYQIYRYDNNSENEPHYARLNFGRVTNKKIAIKGSHEHMYNQKFAVLFPFLSNHYEAKETEKRSFSEARSKIIDDFYLNNSKIYTSSETLAFNIDEIKYPTFAKPSNLLGKTCEKC